MRFINAIALVASAAAVVKASNHGYPQSEGHSSKYQNGNQYQGGWSETPSAVEQGPPPVHTTAPPAPDSYEGEIKPAPAGAKIHTVIVGGSTGLVYTPQEILADVGDEVLFIFQRQNHSVTQSTFAKPCERLPAEQGGVDSGLKANPNDTVVPAPEWKYTVLAKEPTWWYCKQKTGNHCGKGMVFAINPTKEKTFQKFKEVAIADYGEKPTTTAPAPSATDVTTTITLINDGQPTETPSVNPDDKQTPPPAYVAPGWNEGGNPSACNCACFCGVAPFPQGDGIGSFGGVGGQLSSPWKV